MTDHAPILIARGVSFSYRPSQPVLADVSIEAQAKEFLCLLGPNGCGKTTLLRLLLGQLTPDHGEVLLDGRSIAVVDARTRARRMAYVPQQPISAFAFTVRQIVLMGRFAHVGTLGLTGRKDRDIAEAAMEMTKTTDLADRTLSELSGGEAQRVMIARALAQQPAVLLLDEPTSHLDIHHQLTIYDMMRRLAHEWAMAVVCVSHDINLASRFADRLSVLRDGTILADGSAGEVLTSETLRATYDVEVDFLSSPAGPPMVRARLERP